MRHSSGPAAAAVLLGLVAAPFAASGAEEVEIVIASPAAAHYRTVEPEPAVHELRLPRTVAARWSGIIWSDRLAEAARIYAGATVELDTTELPTAFLQFLLPWAGCPESSATVITLSTSENSTTDLLLHLDQAVRQGRQQPTHIGAARVAVDDPPFRWRWVAIASHRSVVFANPVTRHFEAGDDLSLSFRLLDQLTDPTVVLLDPAAQLHELEAARRPEGWHEISHHFEETGAWRLQIMAEGAKGPQVVTQVPLTVGIDEKQPLVWRGAGVGPPPPSDNLGEAELELVQLVNDDRQRLGLAPLIADPRLASIARDHSRDMEENHFFSHESPTAGGLGDRLARASYLSRRSRENIAQASTVRGTQTALWESPSHRANILAVDVTHIGVGIVLDENGSLVATQIFAEPLRQPTRAEVVAAVADQVRSVRLSEGLPELGRSQQLDRAASRLAEAAAETGRLDRDALAVELEGLTASGLGVSRINAELRSFGSIEVLDVLDLATASRPSAAGYGVAERESPAGPVFTVVVIAVW